MSRRSHRVGRLAQLVEHLVYTERVGGSSPSAPTSPDLAGQSPALRQNALARMRLAILFALTPSDAAR